MKKLLYITGVLCFMAVAVERSLAQEVSVGIKWGVGGTRILNSGNDLPNLFLLPDISHSGPFIPERLSNTDSTGTTYPFGIGFQAGAFVEIDFGRFSLQPEVFYSRQGGEIRTEQEGVIILSAGTSNVDTVDSVGTRIVKEQLDYLQIPVLMKYETSFGLNMFLGPQLGILLGTRGTQEIKYTDEFKNDIDDLDLTGTAGELEDTYFEQSDIPRYNAVDFSAVFGIGYKRPLGPGKVGIDVRYTLGLANMFNFDYFREGSAFFNDDAIQTNQTLQLSISYQYTFSK